MEGYEKGNYNEHIDFQTNYLKRVFNVVGITDIQVIYVDGESSNKKNYDENIMTANNCIINMINSIQ